MSLSDKMKKYKDFLEPTTDRIKMLHKEDVKEFIKEDMDLINDYVEGRLNLGGLIKKRNELIGEGLI